MNHFWFVSLLVLLGDTQADSGPQDGCSGRYTCNSSIARYVKRLCSCEEDCHMYAMCCEDIHNQTLIPEHMAECVGKNEGIFVVTSCPRSYSNKIIVNRCENARMLEQYISSPPELSEWPVTSMESRTKYRNIHCAMCNGENLNNLQMWTLGIVCNKRKGLSELWCKTYLWSDMMKLGRFQVKCSTIIDECPVGYQDDLINQKCKYGYAAIVYINSSYYKNSHCAVCHGANMEHGICRSPFGDHKIPGVEYDIMILVNPSGNRKCWTEKNTASRERRYLMEISDCNEITSQLARCRESELFNLKSRKCEAICPDGERPINGYCEPYIINCTYLDLSTFQNLTNSIRDFEVLHWAHDVGIRLKNASQYCFTCDWREIDNQEVKTEDNVISAGGKTYAYPFFHISDHSESIWQVCEPIGSFCDASFIVEDPARFHYLYELSDKKAHYHREGVKIRADETQYCAPCQLIHVPTEEILEQGDNSTVTVELRSGKVYQRPFFYIDKRRGGVTICESNFTKYEVNSYCNVIGDTSIITLIMVLISTFFLVVMAVVYIAVPIFHNVPGLIILSQVVCGLLANVIFLSKPYLSDSSREGCLAGAYIYQYFFIASYFWSFLYAVEVVRAVFAMHIVDQTARNTYFRYSLVGWLVPLLLLVVTITCSYINIPDQYKPNIGGYHCWFTTRLGLQLYFLLPIAILFCINFLIYITVIVKFIVLACQTLRARSDNHEKLFITIKLFFGFGLLWIFGILSAALKEVVFLNCLFMFLTGLNGLIMCCVFMGSRKVLRSIRSYVTNREEFVRRLRRRSTTLSFKY